MRHAARGRATRCANRCDRNHVVRCLSGKPGRATMICILKAAVME